MSRADPVIVVLVAPGEPDPPGLEPLRDQAVVRTVSELAALEAALDGADVLAVYDFGTEFIDRLGPRAGEVEWIHAASAGVDAVLTPAVVNGQTLVTNAQGVFDEAIAEWVLAVLLALTKDLPTTLALQSQGIWRHRDSQRLAGRTVVVVGAGSIGRAIGRLCDAVGMRVRGVARRARADEPGFEAVVGTDSLLAELARADDVVVATPLTAATRHLIDAAAFGAMRNGARLVNVGRGPVVDEAALLAALRSGQVGAAALDVFETEPLPPDHPFWSMPQVIVSPHMSGDVAGWREELTVAFAANVERWRNGRPLLHLVDKHTMAGSGQ